MKHTLLTFDDGAALARELVARREALGLKQADLARRLVDQTGWSLPVARAHVSAWESGKHRLLIPSLLTWLRALGFAGLMAYESSSFEAPEEAEEDIRDEGWCETCASPTPRHFIRPGCHSCVWCGTVETEEVPHED